MNHCGSALAMRQLVRFRQLLCAAACLLVLHNAGAAPLAWSETREMVLVVTDDWHADHATLQLFRRDSDHWRASGAVMPVTIGTNGAAWGSGLHDTQPGPMKREGDGRSPAGVFRIGEAFGYEAAAPTSLPYRQMQASSYCVDVPTSPFYNRIVDTREVGAAAIAGSTEPMRRDIHLQGDQRYRLGFVIEHNSERRSGAGSCIFGHLWKAPGAPTAGCTAMDEMTMQRVLSFIHPSRRPVFVLLPRSEYLRLREDWSLPVLSDL